MIIDDGGESARRRLILGLLGASLMLITMLLGLLWLRAHCDSCDRVAVADETTTTVAPAGRASTAFWSSGEASTWTVSSGAPGAAGATARLS